MGHRFVTIRIILSSLLRDGWTEDRVLLDPSPAGGDGVAFQPAIAGIPALQSPDGTPYRVEIAPSDPQPFGPINVDCLTEAEHDLFRRLGRGETVHDIAADSETSVAEIGRLRRRLMQHFDLATPLALRRCAVQWIRRCPSSGSSGARPRLGRSRR